MYAGNSFNERCGPTFPRAGNTLPLGCDSAEPVELATVTVAEEVVHDLPEMPACCSLRLSAASCPVDPHEGK